MTTIPQTDTHLTFAAIDAHVRAQTVAVPPQTEATSPQTSQRALHGLLARYTTIRPILVALAAIPLIPPAWRTTLIAFTTTADQVALSETLLTSPAPAPLPIDPDFKAGKDQ